MEEEEKWSLEVKRKRLTGRQEETCNLMDS